MYIGGIRMANVIAVIWDCDKTLINGYMQDPIFESYNINAHDFWEKNNEEIDKYLNEGINVNRDTYYLNFFIKCANDKGPFDLKGLNNEKLREFGRRQKFYPGIPEIFEKTKNMFKDNNVFSEYGIQVEHYIVSTGFSEVIRGSALMPFDDDVWGCELLEHEDEQGNAVIGEIAYTIDNTTKTRALFEINKGIGKIDGIDVNSSIPKDLRRVQFENMIYIADGPSDIPAFSVVHQYGGATFAIYPKGDNDAMRQVEQMRIDHRVDMYAEADYSENTTAYLWITNKINDMAEKIRNREQQKIQESSSSAPRHLV